MPPGVVTVTGASPATWGGVMKTISFGEIEVGVTVTPSTFTFEPSTNHDPLIVTGVPPSIVPELGESDVTTGVGGMNVKAPGSVPVPPAVVTTTSTVPASCAGVVTISEPPGPA